MKLHNIPKIVKQSPRRAPSPGFAFVNPKGGVNDGGFLEGWFKTIKHRFGLHRFGESALQEGFPTEATALARNERQRGTMVLVANII